MRIDCLSAMLPEADSIGFPVRPVLSQAQKRDEIHPNAEPECEILRFAKWTSGSS